MNAYFMLGLLVFWLASVTGAYFKGSAAAQDAARAAYAVQLESAITEHNATAQADVEAARAAGQKEAKIRTKVVTVTNTVEKVLHEKPADPICKLNPATFELLLASVALANGTDPDTASKLPDPGKPAGKPR